MIRVAATLAALVLALPDEPYVRSRVDTSIPSDPDAHCLWWPAGTVGFQQVAKGNPETRPAGSEFTAVSRSFQSWQQVMNECGNLTLVEGPRVESATVGYDPTTTDNRNTIVFRDTFCADVAPASSPCWRDQSCMNVFDCWQWGRNTIALTTTTYDRTAGRIFDSDVEFNSFSFIFTTVDAPPCVPPVFNQSCVATDVQNTMTHEAGHLLGMDHTARVGSTMNPSAPAGETSKRSIDPGSRAFVCEVYPQGLASRDCVVGPMPMELGPADPGCGAAGGGPWLAGLAGLGLWLTRRGRRR